MSRGLLLPEGVVQPFDLRYAADDLHVMAFFEGHDSYEAVEAMIRRRPGGAFRVRAMPCDDAASTRSGSRAAATS
jgi:hypothetical protein